MYGLTLITPPSSEPVDVATLKQHLRLNTTAEDALLTGFIKAARELFETLTDRSCLTTTWRLSLDAFPRVVRLPRAPLQSVTSVSYYDSNDNLTVWDASKYAVDTAREPGRVVPKVWFPDWRIFAVYPPLSFRQSPKVVIDFVAGWTTDAIPQLVRQAITLQAASYYEQRSTGGELAPGFNAIVNQFKLGWHGNMNPPMYGYNAYSVE